MSGPRLRLTGLAAHFLPTPNSQATAFEHQHNIHTLSPTLFLPRAAAIEPEVDMRSL